MLGTRLTAPSETTPPGQPIAALRATGARRVVGAVVQAALGVILLWLSVTVEGGTIMRLFFVLLGGFVLWQTLALYRATGISIVLTEEGLFEDTGNVIARLDNIRKVDRSFFAVKPSNGFSIALVEPGPRAWRPGLWWRIGRRVGVGGTTSGKAARDLADVITVLKSEEGAELVAAARAAQSEDPGR